MCIRDSTSAVKLFNNSKFSTEQFAELSALRKTGSAFDTVNKPSKAIVKQYNDLFSPKNLNKTIGPIREALRARMGDSFPQFMAEGGEKEEEKPRGVIAKLKSWLGLVNSETFERDVESEGQTAGSYLTSKETKKAMLDEVFKAQGGLIEDEEKNRAYRAGTGEVDFSAEVAGPTARFAEETAGITSRRMAEEANLINRSKHELSDKDIKAAKDAADYKQRRRDISKSENVNRLLRFPGVDQHPGDEAMRKAYDLKNL